MNIPTQHQVFDHVTAHFGMTRSEVLDLFKTPMHPASMRDEFAKYALQGLLANPGEVCDTGRLSLPEYISARAYEYADAMLAERTKEK